MGSVYNGQSKLRIELDTTIDVSGATTRIIKYKKPSGITGQWTASLKSDKQTIYYDVQVGDINEANEWTVWSHVTWTGNINAPGEPVKIKFLQEGT